MEQGSTEWLEALRREFQPDYERGELIRVSSHQRPDLLGREAGHIDNCGYVRVSFRGRKHLRSHLIWALANGRLPREKLDHINRARTDDRPSNLREVGHHENMWNRTPKPRSLPMGVSLKEGRYQARIMCRRQRIALGSYDTIEAAVSAYQKARKEMFGEYA